MNVWRDETPDEEEQHRYNRQIEEEDVLPSPRLHNKRAVERTKHSSCLGDHPNEAKCKPAPFFSIEIACDGHSDRHNGSPTGSLYKACSHEPHEARRNEPWVA